MLDIDKNINEVYITRLMSRGLNNEHHEYTTSSRAFEALRRPARIVGSMALYGASGYLLAKGLDAFVLEVDDSNSFESYTTAGAALIGAYFESQK